MKGVKAKIQVVNDWFKDIFDKLPKWVEDIAPDIFSVTKNLRNLLEDAEKWLEGDGADLIVKVIPGDWDDRFREIMIIALQNSIPVMIKIEDCNGDLGCMLQQFLKALTHETDKGAKGKLIGLTSTILGHTDSNKLAENRYDRLAQIAYSKLIKS